MARGWLSPVQKQLEPRRVAFALDVEQICAARHLLKQRTVLWACSRAVVSNVDGRLLTIDHVVARETVRVPACEIDELETARMVMARSAPREQGSIGGRR